MFVSDFVLEHFRCRSTETSREFFKLRARPAKKKTHATTTEHEKDVNRRYLDAVGKVLRQDLRNVEGSRCVSDGGSLCVDSLLQESFCFARDEVSLQPRG